MKFTARISSAAALACPFLAGCAASPSAAPPRNGARSPQKVSTESFSLSLLGIDTYFSHAGNQEPFGPVTLKLLRTGPNSAEETLAHFRRQPESRFPRASLLAGASVQFVNLRDSLAIEGSLEDACRALGDLLELSLPVWELPRLAPPDDWAQMFVVPDDVPIVVQGPVPAGMTEREFANASDWEPRPWSNNETIEQLMQKHGGVGGAITLVCLQKAMADGVASTELAIGYVAMIDYLAESGDAKILNLNVDYRVKEGEPHPCVLTNHPLLGALGLCWIDSINCDVAVWRSDAGSLEGGSRSAAKPGLQLVASVNAWGDMTFMGRSFPVVCRGTFLGRVGIERVESD